MKISFFGSLGERIGRDVEFPLAEDCTIADLRTLLSRAHPHAEAELMRPAVRACVDHAMVDDKFVVSLTASVAFLPPLSGG